MTEPIIQTLGITRWSYPGQSRGFRRSADDLDHLRAQLYAPHRLDHRLFLLEHLLIPCLAHQTDPDFLHLIVIGDQLPDPWRSRIQELAESLPQLRVVIEPEGNDMREMLAEVIPRFKDNKCDVIAQYRLDDDDAVAVEFIAKSREIFAGLQPFFAADGIAALDYTRGFIMSTGDSGLDIRSVSSRFWAPGMMVFQDMETAKSLFEFPHMRVWHDMPTLTWKETPMFIRGSHHDNDSELSHFGRRTKSFKFNPQNLSRYMGRRFGIDLKQMREEWTARQQWFMGQTESQTAAQ